MALGRGPFGLIGPDHTGLAAHTAVGRPGTSGGELPDVGIGVGVGVGIDERADSGCTTAAGPALTGPGRAPQRPGERVEVAG
ncbi:hypothetical protein [Streptomyces pini]|uniref:Uncharacterized protein n=1 Tax=Streptomyces pini TaxID=1520580 RepID=A0A1I4LMP6_9ACTN|nr:hypothetical protein [Streptomyces pini]SFL92083.1 hypothetical protein SAMN05192584_13217 [Streptomyces pini]